MSFSQPAPPAQSGSQQIRAHPWFNLVLWDATARREARPPIRPGTAGAFFPAAGGDAWAEEDDAAAAATAWVNFPHATPTSVEAAVFGAGYKQPGEDGKAMDSIVQERQGVFEGWGDWDRSQESQEQ